MKRIGLVLLIIFTLVTGDWRLGTWCYAQEEETFILTTYYPAPYGVYKNLKTTQDTYLATDSGNVGIGVTGPAGRLHVVGPDDAATVVAFMPGADTAAPGTPSLNVGIGATTPEAKLDVVNGNIQIRGGEPWTKSDYMVRLKSPLTAVWRSTYPNLAGKYMGIGMTYSG